LLEIVEDRRSAISYGVATADGSKEGDNPMSANKMTRRDFLLASAMSAAGLALAACAQQTPTISEPAATATSAPAKAPTNTPEPEVAAAGKEAPDLSALVAGGNLPALEERIPANTLVLEPIHGIGEYGGTLRRFLGSNIQEYMYSHSPLRYIDEGLDIAPGMCESWEGNADNTEWTFFFRKGLKWSDGEPCTVDDVMFWWEDMVLNLDHGDSPPDFGRAGGKLVEFVKEDDYTLKLKYQVSSPLTPWFLAGWVNAGVDARWIAARHYLEQFHPTYNKAMTDFGELNEKMTWRSNPECPALSTWTAESIDPGARQQWKRNPFYYCVDSEGNQLPYIDGLDEKSVSDVEVQKLEIMQGNVDFECFHGLFLEDVSVLKLGEPEGNYEARFWDSGSGTGMNYFWNYDHPDDNMRALYRTPEFKWAMSNAINRDEIQEIVYYGTGWPSTGTMTVKSIQFNFSDKAKEFYKECRDSHVEYDPEKAMALLDGIGVVDADGDGYREYPDGSKLEVVIDISGTLNKEAAGVLEITRKNWGEIGLNIVINPMSSSEFGTNWRGGLSSIRTQWECCGPPDQLTWTPWLIPQEPSRWAPLCAGRRQMLGTPKEDTELDKSPWDRSPPRWASTEPEYYDGPVRELDDIYAKLVLLVDNVERHESCWELIRKHVIENMFIMGTVANYPRIIIVSKDLMNVPTREETATGGLFNTWVVPAPAVYSPETWAFKKA
jgi:peptide/nickel transport system substrate-binding protein